ncbi:MAG TPA: hypothetical protein VFH08_17270 [Chitinophagaceae bacterium]|nr:hypothetical protein [Chitinophagaceae bacterium]
MKIHFCFSMLLISMSTLNAQVMLEFGASGQTRDGALIIYGSDNLQHAIPYDKIKGSPYWNKNWLKAFLFDQRDTSLGSYKARFNFATNELHYIDKRGKEQIAIPGTLNSIVFMRSDDSTQIGTVFRTNVPEVRKRTICKICFVQELNQGDVKLLKVTQRLLRTKDSLFGTLKTYYFYDHTEYFVQHGELYERIKRLNKDLVFGFIPGANDYKDWIKEKELRFSKEEDYLIFLNHYNSTRKVQ